MAMAIAGLTKNNGYKNLKNVLTFAKQKKYIAKHRILFLRFAARFTKHITLLKTLMPLQKARG